MNLRVAKSLLAFSSLILLLGAVAHARAFPGAVRALGGAGLSPIYSRDFKALWLGDSATLLIVAVFFGALVVRPSIAGRAAVVLVALIPAATAVLIYIFVGNFYAGHLLLGASAAAVLAVFSDRDARLRASSRPSAEYR